MRGRERVVIAALAAGGVGLAVYLTAAPPAGLPGVFEMLAPTGVLLGLALLGLGALLRRRRRR